ncbi:fumarylacetoacetate hydrolase family protein [Sphingorhabdus lacus]|uniref:FAA hydrolase family protein n=1 Tax=Sphingorhabdus lacus TaxID=392610 RepID=A0A6I6L228_9SPHN|nr:fumarylacetoacetate hydrolase family protein [Sphingorhabdus lacus]QGY79239.1 FAA hydrolase family protein [Sphingorhabdus lacus]
MKLLSFVRDGKETWGAVVNDGVVDLGAALPQFPELTSYIAAGRHLHAAEDVQGRKPDLVLDKLTLLPVIPRPEKIICVARNYLGHHQEVLAAGKKVELAGVPPIFLRTWRSQVAHDQPMVKPRSSNAFDWEGELAVIISKEGRDIPEDKASEYVAGYACYNEASVRDWQFASPQITPGKNFDFTGGFGPWMVTPDEATPEDGLSIVTRLNGEVVQSSTTDRMIFNIAQIIAYASQIMTLVPGDVIATGTPDGVGWTRDPQLFMLDGDVCEVEIEGVGLLRNPIVER